jgi:hypothetical protein
MLTAPTIPLLYKVPSASIAQGPPVSTSFTHGEVFPVVHRLITDRTCKGSDFITHQELVDGLLGSRDGVDLVTAAEPNSKFDRRGIASNMVAWFSQRFTAGVNEFSELLQREKVDGSWAYRSTQVRPTAPLESVAVIPDVDPSIMEGNPELVAHIRRERSPALVKAKLQKVRAESGRLECACCGFDAKVAFPGLGFPIVEVHHRTSLATYEASMPTSLDDLAVLCPTCHRALHRAGDVTVEAFTETYFPGD